jgi:hypothetical protein
MHDGLYYLDNNMLHVIAAASTHCAQEELIIHHHKLGHIPFAILGRLYPELYNRVSKEKLVCDACQYGKQTRSSYILSNNWSII